MCASLLAPEDLSAFPKAVVSGGGTKVKVDEGSATCLHYNGETPVG